MKILTLFVLTLGPQAAAVPPEGSVTVTGRFELRSDARVALHHFLIDWASADVGEWPPYALAISERDGWDALLDEDERDTWASAVDAYGAAVGRSLLFDDGLVAVRDWSAGALPLDDVPASERALADAVDSALPIFRRHFWPAHDEKNRRWIDSVAPTLDDVEDAMIARFESAYGGRWPDARVPVDVMVYANAVGAYSTGGRLTVSSADRGLQMPQAIEMIYHEASHTDELEAPLRAGLSDAFRAVGAEEPDRFWHDVIFFTSGDIARLVLAEHGVADYRHYGSFGVYRRRERWVKQIPALEGSWRPFLESQSEDPDDRRRALEALVAALTSTP